eukprot:TRINITY_DN7168_c0_g1_i1.p1 TRINITY_DN7168_c0_g1~~TRINITY_DN7168_c0_g1_i1.p1  ORF type:complete len:76 (-),score=9.12 TRINITY_DN7168_c0_g1_i1:480-707(-)
MKLLVGHTTRYITAPPPKIHIVFYKPDDINHFLSDQQSQCPRDVRENLLHNVLDHYSTDGYSPHQVTHETQLRPQ